MQTIFKKETFFSCPKKDLFTFHERKDAFSLLTPATENIEVLSTASTLKPSNDVVRFINKFLFLKFKFEMIHTTYEPYDLFVDEQKKGLFSFWRHQHRFIEGGWDKDPASCLLDEIRFGHPLLPFFLPFVKNKLGKLFEYRHDITGKELHMANRNNHDLLPATVIVTGATGLIGKRVTEILVEKGVRVFAFVRNTEKAKQVFGDRVTYVHWDFTHPEQGNWKEVLSKADGVVHLAGTPLFKQRWTKAFKKKMESSRVLGTRQLVDAIRESTHKPKSFVSASAIGIYGTNPELAADEKSTPADDLLARICTNWEDEANKLDEQGVRTALIRIGIVLSKESGALKETLPLFRLGMGGTMGKPNHFMNWIHLEDIARIFVMALGSEEMKGPYNASAPNPVQTAQYYKTLASVLKRPAIMRYPVPVLKMILGEAGEYASGGPRSITDKIQKAGYRFFFSDLDEALKNLIGN